MIVNVEKYLYRHFDNMLIVFTENNECLYLYCPSECIYQAGDIRFYCYITDITQREYLKIEYIKFHKEPSLSILCDGIADFIQYDIYNRNPLIRGGFEIQRDLLPKDFNYWDKFNEPKTIQKDKERRQWKGLCEAMSDMTKTI